MTIRQSRQTALRMIDLIDTLVRQQHRLIIGAEQACCEGALAEGYGAPLDRQAGVYAGLDLGACYGRAGGEEVGCDFVGGGCGEGGI